MGDHGFLWVRFGKARRLARDPERAGKRNENVAQGHGSDGDKGPEAHAAVQESGEDGQIERSFHYRDKKMFTRIYVQYVRPHVEFAAPEIN